MTSPLRALSSLNCRHNAPALTLSDLSPHFTALTGWEYVDDHLIKTFRFANYYETMAFVNALAYVSHRQDHHPDLSVHYNRVVVTYSTHDAGGVTLNDCICAAKAETLSGG